MKSTGMKFYREHADMEIIEIEETESTNSWVAERRAMLDTPTLAYACRQTAGRGQRGNSWESEPYKNLCASALLHPAGVAPQRQFVVSEAVALAVADLLRSYGVEAKVKWPNDIYVGDRKICGILIEHAITPTEILYTIAGMGVNLNQERFVSDAPNPVSLTQLTGETYSVAEAAGRLGEALERRMAMTCTQPERLHEEFMASLWRGDGGAYPFIDHLRGERIMACIEDVEPDGILTLRTVDGERRRFAFKEVVFIV